MTQNKDMVIVYFDEDGKVDFLVNGDGIRLLIVDERAPHDRVYEITRRDPVEKLSALLRNDQIGHCKDGRHEAVANRVAAALEGKPHLTVIE